MKANVHPLDIVFRLAEDHGIVLLNGSGFAAPDWSVRISFANLDDHVYDDIGRAVRAIARGYRQAYEAATGKSGKPAGAIAGEVGRDHAAGHEGDGKRSGSCVRAAHDPDTAPVRRTATWRSTPESRDDEMLNALRDHPELAIFLTLAVGVRDWPDPDRVVQTGQRRRARSSRACSSDNSTSRSIPRSSRSSSRSSCLPPATRSGRSSFAA